jgi:hypothetical protein
LRAQREQTIKALIELVEADPPPLHADLQIPLLIELLGEYRAVEGANMLVKRIDYSPPGLRDRELHPLNKYPAAKALVSIGSASFPAINRRLAHPVTDRQLAILAWVIYLIDGEELGKYRLDLTAADRLDAQGDVPDHLRNVERLLDTYQRLDFSNPLGP